MNRCSRLTLALGLLIASLLTPAYADLKVPEGTYSILPLARDELNLYWPDHPWPATLMAQFEKETCVSLTSPRCMTTRAELKTDREYGFSLGQFTIAYNKDGSERFNAWKSIKAANQKALQDWTWERRLDPRLSVRAVILYDRSIYQIMLKATADPVQALKMAYAGYNGGSAGTLQEIRLCAQTANCNPASWDSVGGRLGVEATSRKSRVKYKGYGQSFFDINRAYPKEITGGRVIKYEPFFE